MPYTRPCTICSAAVKNDSIDSVRVEKDTREPARYLIHRACLTHLENEFLCVACDHPILPEQLLKSEPRDPCCGHPMLMAPCPICHVPLIVEHAFCYRDPLFRSDPESPMQSACVYTHHYCRPRWELAYESGYHSVKIREEPGRRLKLRVCVSCGQPFSWLARTEIVTALELAAEANDSYGLGIAFRPVAENRGRRHLHCRGFSTHYAAY